MKYKSTLLQLFVCMSLTITTDPARATDAAEEARIRQIVADILQPKVVEIERLQERVHALEAIVESQRRELGLRGDENDDSASNNQSQQPGEDFLKQVTVSEAEPVRNLASEVDELRQQLNHRNEHEGLKVSGFFDVSARTENPDEKTYTLGPVELDLDYAYAGIFAASTALVWENDKVEVAVAFIDYHHRNHEVVTRGSIFGDPGYHLQVGRFDLPFALDYQYFAAPDRLSITAPQTTERLQSGGFNSEGMRAYGTRGILDYTLFWTNSVYDDDGSSLGGRLALATGRLVDATGDSLLVNIGVSGLFDMDGDGGYRNAVYGLDMTLAHGESMLLAEGIYRDSEQLLSDANGNNLGDRDEYAYHLTLIHGLQNVVEFPLYAFARYGEWVPSYEFVLDQDDASLIHRVESIPRVSLGLGLDLNDYLKLKLEYTDSLGHQTREPGFDRRVAIAQLVIGF